MSLGFGVGQVEQDIGEGLVKSTPAFMAFHTGSIRSTTFDA